MGNTLKEFFARLAMDWDQLARWHQDPEGAMAAAGLEEFDRELVRRAPTGDLLAHLASTAPSPPRAAAAERASQQTQAPRSEGSLIIVGTGIRSVGQMTVEAIAHIKAAEQVLYLVAEPIAVEVIRSLNPSGSHSLADLYRDGKARRDTYRQMVERIINSVRSGWRTCAVFYGHPGVFVDPAHAALRQAREEGFSARMLAAISAEDCLFADLGIDPSTAGCQSYEAADFLINQRQIDPTSHAVIWQVGVLGDRTFSLQVRAPSNALELLVRRLTETYPAEHQVCIYEAAVLPGREARATWGEVARLGQSQLSIVSTLYIPPSEPPRFDPKLYVAMSGSGQSG